MRFVPGVDVPVNETRRDCLAVRIVHLGAWTPVFPKKVIAAGGDAKKVVFSGVAKTADEMRFALQLGIKCFNVESVAELERRGR